MGKAMTTDSNRSPAAKVTDEAINLAVEGAPLIPRRPRSSTPTRLKWGHEIQRAADEGRRSSSSPPTAAAGFSGPTLRSISSSTTHYRFHSANWRLELATSWVRSNGAISGQSRQKAAISRALAYPPATQCTVISPADTRGYAAICRESGTPGGKCPKFAQAGWSRPPGAYC